MKRQPPSWRRRPTFGSSVSLVCCCFGIQAYASRMRPVSSGPGWSMTNCSSINRRPGRRCTVRSRRWLSSA
jgi:hypothetical protein